MFLQQENEKENKSEMDRQATARPSSSASAMMMGANKRSVQLTKKPVEKKKDKPYTLEEALGEVHTVYTFHEEVNHWMSTNHLKLNADKIELLWVGSKIQSTASCRWAATSMDLPLQIDSATVTVSDHIHMYFSSLAMQVRSWTVTDSTC